MDHFGNVQYARTPTSCHYKFSEYYIVTAAATGCLFFKQFAVWVPEVTDAEMGLWLGMKVDIDLDSWKCVGNIVVPEEFEIRLSKGMIQAKLHADKLRLYLETRSLLSSPGPCGAIIHSCIDSDLTFSRARQLLNKCLDKHSACKQTGSAPSRLLDVSSDAKEVRLVDTNTVKDPVWAALSYCWGGSQDAQTTYLNVEDRYKQLAIDHLPLTIRDAIHVCRQMHIPYLWVDSICIIQTEDESEDTVKETDKDRELRKMAGIYQGAILTISASCAISANEGFLHERKPFTPGVALPIRLKDDYHVAQIVEKGSTDWNPLQAEPSESRAWIFQEQLLSSRSLRFTTHAMEWHCKCFDCCISQEEEYNVYSQPAVFEDFSLGRWNSVVTDYSKRLLSNSEDRPIAIAAVAESFAKSGSLFNTSDYVAGLWKPSLLADLLWFVKPPVRGKACGSAPSWSWTSVLEHVEWLEDCDSFASTARVLSVDIQLADPKLPCGAVKSGKIRLRGMMSRKPRPVVCVVEDEPAGNEGHSQFILPDDVQEKQLEVFCFELAHATNGLDSMRLGLALQPTANPGEFSRVGLYIASKPKVDDRSHSENCEACKTEQDTWERTIEIV
jgi:hypothetical protein